uniref:Uncharacterized protein n=1 Tax=Oryza glumipatula TaxID=40148 RepID=A0A0D9ZG55_9ORYZ
MEAKREFFFCSGGLGFTNVALVLFTTWFYSYEWCGGFSVNEIDSIAKHLPSPEKVHDFIGVLRNKYDVE